VFDDKVGANMKEPFGLIFPCNVETNLYPSVLIHDKKYVIQEENTKLRHYLANKLSTNTPFVIPRIAGIENIYALMGDHIRKSKKVTNEVQNYIKKTTYSMKNNAGIQITSIESLLKYSDMYMSSFEHSDLYADWEPWGEVYNGGQDEIANKFKKDTIWACVFDIFHFLYSCPSSPATLQSKDNDDEWKIEHQRAIKKIRTDHPELQYDYYIDLHGISRPYGYIPASMLPSTRGQHSYD